ncbi:MAG: DUF2796 domain-containing protein [Oceanicaulis sp.]
MRAARVLITAALTTFCAGLCAGAASAKSEGLRQLGAHVHGAADLIAAADPDGLLVAELSSPAHNLYGFEGAASPDRMDEVERVTARLTEPGLLSFGEAASCTLADTAIVGAPAPGGGEEPHEHGHGHEDAHDPDDGDHHGDEHSDDHDGAASHGDVTVSWSFQCDAPAQITALDLSGLFAAFERLERVEVQYLDASRAEAGTLTPAAAALRLN